MTTPKQTETPLTDHLREGIESILNVMLAEVTITGGASPRKYTKVTLDLLKSKGLVFEIKQEWPTKFFDDKVITALEYKKKLDGYVFAKDIGEC